MMKALILPALLVTLGVRSLFALEAFEIGKGREGELPAGKEADGIRGDFVLRNDRIVALVSQNAPLRRANMSTFYGADGVTPGCLFDLTLKDEQNDQLIYFGPAGQRGLVSWVRVVPGTKDKSAAVETVVTAEKNGGIYKRHEYRVRDGDQGIWIISTFRNETNAKQTASIKDEWTRFNETGSVAGTRWADAVDPADKAGYAFAQTSLKDVKGSQAIEGETIELNPGQEVTWTRFMAVGHSPLEAWGIVQKVRGKASGTVQLHLDDEAGHPATSARVTLVNADGTLAAYPNAKGDITLSLPTGKHGLIAEEIGRVPVMFVVEVKEADAVKQTIALQAASQLNFAITREDGSSVPCKAQIMGIEGTPSPNLGPTMRAHGCKDQYHSEKGTFTVQVPAGKYHVVVTHGIEFSHHEEDVTVGQGSVVTVKATLKRLVDTTGWVSADFHNHSTQSGDNICGTPDRIINLAAEHIEFAPTTEHNRIYDWKPIIEQLGLSSEMKTVVGMELTGSAAHLNCFPLTVEPYLQDNGAPVWNADARITALTLRGWQGEREDRWIQINHPDLQFLFNDRNLNGRPDGGLVGIETMIDGLETENFTGEGVLADSPWRLSKGAGALATKVEYVRQFIWLQLLNKGYRITPVAVADAHTVYGNGVGGWRMYLPSKTDDPAQIDWTKDLAKEAKAGHGLLTTGPFMTVTTADGKMPGDDVTAHGGVELHVRVQCTDWQDIDRVQVLVNGRKDPDLNFTRKSHPAMFTDGVVKFDQTITVPLKEDSHIIVVATHQTMTLKTGYGTSDQSTLHPMAYHAPFYVDVDGDGFHANGDTLGYDLPVSKMTPDMVRAQLEKAKQPAENKPQAGSGS